MKLKFLGAAGMVTGSSYLLSDGDDSLLVDLGMFQGGREMNQLNKRPLDVDYANLGGVVLTHAHLDHCGRLPLLAKYGYKGPIYMIGATASLLSLSLEDTVKIAHEGDKEVLYEMEDVEKTMNLVRIVDYHEVFEIGRMKLRLRDAGHILGSGFLEVMSGRDKIIFSGDLGNYPQDLIRPTEMNGEAGCVVMESTYGDRDHGSEDPFSVLASEINQIESSQSTLLIPAFSLERTQEILHKIDHLKRTKKVRNETAVYLDSPMAIKATQIFKDYPELYNQELSAHVKTDDPFDFPGLRMTPTGGESDEIGKADGAKVIIAGSGMMTGGRIMKHALRYLGDAKNRILFVGFQAEGSLGRKIVDGEKFVTIAKQRIEVKAGVKVTTAISAHADQTRLLSWFEKIRGVEKLYLTHGEEIPRLVLKEKIKNDGFEGEIVLPKLDQEVVL